jgi:6-pyruvoyltetrahydropterin/6-carboxytetrahydropterin synthase
VPRAALTRRVTFAAAHHYRRPDWSEAKNQEAFGPSVQPHGHGYACEVTVRGEVDRATGMVIDLALLDRVLNDEVRSRFDHRDINREVPEFADGALIPTGENLARVIGERVQAALGARVDVSRVVVREDESLWSEWTP